MKPKCQICQMFNSEGYWKEGELHDMVLEYGFCKVKNKEIHAQDLCNEFIKIDFKENY